jgi:hypothetical protein
MNSQQFSAYLNNPGLVDSGSLILLQEMVAQFPYCQSGQLLLACSLHMEEHPGYPNQLKKAAAYAGDRRMLKDQVGRAIKAQPVEAAHATPLVPLEVTTLEPAPHQFHQRYETSPSMDFEPVYEPLTPDELLAIVKKRLAELAELTLHPHETGTSGQDSGAFGKPPETHVTKASLIDKFIMEEPRISKPKSVFFSPADSSIRSNFDQEEIVSETLAQLYARQGNIAKAVHIYEKLSLINQEKSRYFAAQIEKLGS